MVAVGRVVGPAAAAASAAGLPHSLVGGAHGGLRWDDLKCQGQQKRAQDFTLVLDDEKFGGLQMHPWVLISATRVSPPNSLASAEATRSANEIIPDPLRPTSHAIPVCFHR